MLRSIFGRRTSYIDSQTGHDSLRRIHSTTHAPNKPISKVSWICLSSGFRAFQLEADRRKDRYSQQKSSEHMVPSPRFCGISAIGQHLPLQVQPENHNKHAVPNLWGAFICGDPYRIVRAGSRTLVLKLVKRKMHQITPTGSLKPQATSWTTILNGFFPFFPQTLGPRPAYLLVTNVA